MTVYLQTDAPAFFADIAEVIRVFHGNIAVLPMAADTQRPCVRHTHAEHAGFWHETCTWLDEEDAAPENAACAVMWAAPIARGTWVEKRHMKRAIKQCVYHCLRRHTRVHPPWGSLTGIRPTRLFAEGLRTARDARGAEQWVMRTFDVSARKAALLRTIATVQAPYLSPPADEVDVYVGIPFCTTRCAYCSFASGEIGKGTLVEPYLWALDQELTQTAALMAQEGLTARALYVGGGTPTALSPQQLNALLARMAALFPTAVEWTVEAGRPDTITGEHLRVMRAYPVTRISVNPQTMNDATLAAIGRAHTADEARRAYARAREAGFDHINMDLIAALPGESLADFAHTLACVRALAPDSLTVHTLARKHATRLNEFDFTPTAPAVATAMVEAAQECAQDMGLVPYYLYRQKYMAGNLENVGYTRPGKVCLYNIDIMEETTSILAVGAGAISKRVIREASRIERAPNVSNIEHYIRRVDEMAARKRAVWQASLLS